MTFLDTAKNEYGRCEPQRLLLGEDRFVADDVRTLEVRYGASGERLRTFRESVKEIQQVEFADFPLMPRTTLDYAKAIAAVSESAVAQPHMWVGASRIPEGDRSIFEDECLARVLDAAVTYDCLDITNLCCMELVVRHRQLIAYAHSQSPGMPSYLAEDHCMGQPRRAGGGIVTASLTDHVSKQMAAQSKIMKEKRKMRKQKALAPQWSGQWLTAVRCAKRQRPLEQPRFSRSFSRPADPTCFSSAFVDRGGAGK